MKTYFFIDAQNVRWKPSDDGLISLGMLSYEPNRSHDENIWEDYFTCFEEFKDELNRIVTHNKANQSYNNCPRRKFQIVVHRDKAVTTMEWTINWLRKLHSFIKKFNLDMSFVDRAEELAFKEILLQLEGWEKIEK